MVPLQSSMNVTLPGDGSSGPHNPFPGAQPTIVKFEDRVRALICDVLVESHTHTFIEIH